MEELIRRLVRCGVPQKTAECICNSFVGKQPALEKIVQACEEQPCTTERVASV